MTGGLNKKGFKYPQGIENVIAYDKNIQGEISSLLSDNIYQELSKNDSFQEVKSIIFEKIGHYKENNEVREETINDIYENYGDIIKSILLKNNDQKLFEKIGLTKNSSSHTKKLFDRVVDKYDINKINDNTIATIIIYAIAIKEIELEKNKDQEKFDKN